MKYIIMKANWYTVLGIVLAIAIAIGLMIAFCIYSFYGLMNAPDITITELTEPLKKGVEEKYGYVIPDNAELISGRIEPGQDSSLKLYFSVELEGLPGYKRGMELSEIYELMLDGKKGDADYGAPPIGGIEKIEQEHNVEFSFAAGCERASFTGLWLTAPTGGKIFVYIDGYRPASSWYD